MKKSLLITIIIVAVLALLALWGFSQYNNMITQEENLQAAWAQVENQYQRRADLIPNLVNTVKGYAAHESETLEAVVAARAKATAMTIDPAKVTPEQLSEFQSAQGELSTALGRLMVIQEAYPELKANENFKQLQQQLEGTENRITVARNTFNEAARTYNTLIRRFPANIVAGMAGFDKKPYFEAQESAAQAPVVQF